MSINFSQTVENFKNSTENTTGIGSITLYEITCICTFCAGFPANVSIIYFVCRSQKLKSSTNIIITSLAVADCFYLTWMLISVMDQTYMFLPLSKDLIKFLYSSIDMFLASASIVNVASVSIDRFVECWYSLQYEHIMSKFLSKIIIASWVYSIAIFIMAFTRIIYQNETYNTAVFYVGVFGSFFLPLLIVVLSYSAILYSAYRSIDETERFYKSVGNTLDPISKYDDSIEKKRRSNSSYHQIQIQSIEKRRQQEGFTRKVKVTMVILIIILPFILGWGFHVGTQMYEHMCNTIIKNRIFNYILIITPWEISSFNAYIYFMLNKTFRSVIRRRIQRICDRYKYSLCVNSATESFRSKRRNRKPKLQNIKSSNITPITPITSV